MKASRLLAAALPAALAIAFASGSAFAQAQPAKEFTPEVGQAGKDVIWVPTPDALVEKMLDMAKVTAKDYVIDLGSGDGRTVIAAARRGARAHGIEYEPNMVELSKRNAAKEGLSARATFEKADIFTSDFSKAQVITMFLLDSINLKLRPKILALKPGTRITSNTFKMDDWEPDQSVTLDNCERWCTAHLWIVPAKVGGTWKVGNSELSFKQTFQKLEGRMSDGNVIAPLTGKLNGDQVTFTAGGKTYTGRVRGDTIEGKVGAETWKATRAGNG
jgi:SAM-dependent methyltransferase